MNLQDAPRRIQDYSGRILAFATVVGLLYFGRQVLIPLALAIMIGFLLAPAVRALRRFGAGRVSSVFVVVIALALSCLAMAGVLGVQVLHIAESLPQYETTIHRKLTTLDAIAFGRVRRVTSEARGLTTIEQPEAVDPAASGRQYGAPALASAADADVTSGRSLQLIGKVLKAAWRPLQSTGIVLLVLIFVLLEHESLRDRFIRIAGATDIRATTIALNDAAERLSRYFVSQALVNLLFGAAIGVGLEALRVPQALLWGTLAGVMRFVPYVGAAIAALFATALALAVDPGWTLALCTLALFVVLDVVVAQLLEPRLYGHAAGLSPLSVVVAAIFWSSLWGPVGLVLSTPLTLCLLVAGRHIKPLKELELLLGDAQPLTLPQRFYQRALAGDPHEIVASARDFLKTHSLARYCDRVLLPALHLARLDDELQDADQGHQQTIRRVIVQVVTALDHNRVRPQRRQRRGAVLEEVSAGRWLRQQREALSGKWQGALHVPAGSVVLCLSAGSKSDDLAAELLVRLLRAEKLDARHFSAEEVTDGLPDGADPEGVSLVFLVSASTGPGRGGIEALKRQVRELFGQAQVATVACKGVTSLAEERLAESSAGPEATSLEQALEFCLSRRQGRPKAGSLLPVAHRHVLG